MADDESNMPLAADVAPVPQKPASPRSWLVAHRTAAEWALLAFAALGYGMVYLAVVNALTALFFAGMSLCLIVAAASIAMQFLPGRTSLTGDSAELTGLAEADAPAIIARWARRVIKAVRERRKG